MPRHTPNQYPGGLNPDDYIGGELFDFYMNMPGVVAVGDMVESPDVLNDISEDMRDLGVVGVLPLVVGSKDDPETPLTFPVYFTEIDSYVDGLHFTAPVIVTEKHLSAAREYVAELVRTQAPGWSEDMQNWVAYSMALNWAYSDEIKRQKTEVHEG